MRFKERETDILYECVMVPGGSILVRKLPHEMGEIERISLDDFIERFDESYV